MIMKNAENAKYAQKDHKVKIKEREGIEILPIKSALEKYEWVKKYFSEKPKEGYFVWVKKQIKCPLITCVSVASENVKQEMQNLIIIEKGINISVYGSCNSVKKSLKGKHYARGKIILREGARLSYNHIHSWDKEDEVNTEYEFNLEKNSKLEYNYNCISPPKNLSLNTKVVCLEKSTANLKICGICENSEMKINDDLILKENKSSGVLKLRLVGKENSKITSNSSIIAESECKGHLDCQGLPIDKTSKITLIPELVCKNNQAQITHEASIGKISEEELFYLQSRGLSEQEAINLIINGFLEIS